MSSVHSSQQEQFSQYDDDTASNKVLCGDDASQLSLGLPSVLGDDNDNDNMDDDDDDEQEPKIVVCATTNLSLHAQLFLETLQQPSPFRTALQEWMHQQQHHNAHTSGNQHRLETPSAATALHQVQAQRQAFTDLVTQQGTPELQHLWDHVETDVDRDAVVAHLFLPRPLGGLGE